MAIEQHKRNRYIDYVRQVVGDTDGLLFSDDEMKSYIEKWTSTDLSTATPTASNSRYRVCGCASASPLYELTVTSGDDGAVYVIDEYAALVYFDPDDASNTAVAPVDGTNITVTYYDVNTNQLFVELFMVLSSNHAKLVMAQNIMGVEQDLRKLSDSFYKQAVRWAAEPGCGGCC